ncbi:MAG: hypothetical protein HZB38_15090 [Planctomycetes bacterium]|nr:hypothetical protein [Planctomycetota bacterium]
MAADVIRTACTSCDSKIKVPVHAAGKRVRCPKCQNVFVVPTPDAPVVGDGGEEADLLAGLGAGTTVQSDAGDAALREAALRAAQARATPVASASTPAREKKQRSRSNLGPMAVVFFGTFLQRSFFGRFCLVALLGGIALIALGVSELRLRERASEEPQTITCEALTANGPGDNYHVIMTDYVLLPYYVYEKRFTVWKGAWVPAVSHAELKLRLAAELNVPEAELETVEGDRVAEALQNMKPSDFQFKVIVSFPKADGPDYIDALGEDELIQGTIFESLASMDSDGKRLLRQGYPHVKLEDCYILVAGREPRSAASAQLQMFGGGGLALVALGAAAWGAKQAAG